MKLKSHWANTQYTVSKMYLVQHSVDLNFGQTEESFRDTRQSYIKWLHILKTIIKNQTQAIMK